MEIYFIPQVFFDIAMLHIENIVEFHDISLIFRQSQ